MEEAAYVVAITAVAHSVLVIALAWVRPRRTRSTVFSATLVPAAIAFLVALIVFLLTVGPQVADERSPELGMLGVLGALIVSALNLAVSLVVAPMLVKHFARV